MHPCAPLQMDVQPGVAYGIVVTGYDGQFGTYEIAITADQVGGAAWLACIVCCPHVFLRDIGSLACSVPANAAGSAYLRVTLQCSLIGMAPPDTVTSRNRLSLSNCSPSDLGPSLLSLH